MCSHSYARLQPVRFIVKVRIAVFKIVCIPLLEIVRKDSEFP